MPPAPFELDFYQLLGSNIRWDESVRLIWDPTNQTFLYEGPIPQPVPEPAVIPLLIISLTVHCRIKQVLERLIQYLIAVSLEAKSEMTLPFLLLLSIRRRQCSVLSRTTTE